MSFSRRSFLLGTAGAAAGLILPSYYQRSLEFLDRTGMPLIEPVNTEGIALYVEKSPSVNGYELRTTPDMPDYPEWTLQDFCNRYGCDLEWYSDDEDVDYSQPVEWDHEYFYETWYRHESPVTHAFELLRDIDLGPELSSGSDKGAVLFWDHPSPASSYQGVEAVDEISLSLLQKRLDDLGQRFVINFV